MAVTEAQLAALFPAGATLPHISTLRDTTQGSLAVLVQSDEHVVATLPYRTAIPPQELARESYRHMVQALGWLHELCHGTRRVRASCGRRVGWWRRTRCRKVLVLTLVKAAVLAMAGVLVAKTGEWEAASFAPLVLAAALYGLAVNAALRDEVQWRLLPRSVQGAARAKLVLKVVLHGAVLLVVWITSRAVDLSGRKFYIMLAWYFALVIVLFCNGPPPPERDVRRWKGALSVSVSVQDGLFRADGTLDENLSVVPLRRVLAFGASSVDVGDCFARHHQPLVMMYLHEPWETQPIYSQSLSIAEQIARELEEALRRWRRLSVRNVAQQ